MISTLLHPLPAGWVLVHFYCGRKRIGRDIAVPDVRQVATPEGRQEVAKMCGAVKR